MSIIKLSNETIDKLSTLAAINQSVKIVEGAKELRVKKETKTMFCRTPIVEDFPRTVCIYDVRQFVSVLSVFEEVWLDLSNKSYMIIQDKETGAKKKLKYIDAEETMVDSSYFTKDIVVSDDEESSASLLVFPTDAVVVDVEVPGDTIKSTNDVTKKLGLKYIGFKGDGEVVKYSAFSKLDSSEETNGISVELSETDKDFNMFYPAESLELLKGDSKFVIVEAKASIVTCGDMTYYITLDPDSEC